MAAITVTDKPSRSRGGIVHYFYGTGTSNQADTLTSTAVPEHRSQQLCFITVKYSGSPTYTGTALTVEVDSGIGSGYDTTLTSGTDNGQSFSYIPTGEVILGSGDAIRVSAPAGGAVTAAIVICTKDI